MLIYSTPWKSCIFNSPKKSPGMKDAGEKIKTWQIAGTAVHYALE